MKNNYWATSFVSLFFFVVSSNSVLASEGENELMPDFSLPSVSDGTMIGSDDFKGKVLLVNFFATWCHPALKRSPFWWACRRILPSRIFL